jgi:hypothetical protein
LRQTVGTGARESYEAAIAGVWSDLRATLVRLEALAADPDETLAAPDAAETLSALQYSLHRAAELVTGLDPPAGGELLHEELAAALAEARDATAEIAFVVEDGGADQAEPYVYEWRGALFRVRLAQMRLALPVDVPGPDAPVATGSSPSLLLARFLVGGGALVLAAGAVLGLWQLAAVGLSAFAAGALFGET